jgi:alpha-1,2-mannosyltransferase
VTARWMLVTGCVLFALSVGALIAVDVAVAGGLWSMLDLQIYDWGGRVARHGGDLYGLAYQDLRLRFTYPPMAAAVFAVLSYVPLSALKWLASVGSVASLTAVSWLTWGALGYPRSRVRLAGALAIAAVAIWAEPVQQTLAFGQVNIVLMLIIVADMARPDRVWWKGAGVGLAAGFKLTPLIFIPYLLLTGRFRAAGVAVATFAASIAVPVLWLPSQSARYWAGGLFMDSDRLGNGAYVGNQSLRGMLLRLAGNSPPTQGLWVAAAVIVGAGGLLLAAAASRRGQEMAGVVICALTGLLTSPVSWSHHWVWMTPALVLAVHNAARVKASADSRWQQWASWGSVLALIVVFYSRLIWAVPAPAVQGRGLHGPWLLIGNLYVLAGLAALIMAALVMTHPLQSSDSPALDPGGAAVTTGRLGTMPDPAHTRQGCSRSQAVNWGDPSFPDGDPIGSSPERTGSSGREEAR